MKLFNVYIKVMKRHLPMIAVYMLVLYAIIMVMIFQVKSSNTYEEDRVSVLLINEDSENEFMNGLRQYLGSRLNLIEEQRYGGAIQSALFYQTADYVSQIPEGFYEKLKNEGNASIYQYTASSSYAAAYVDKIIRDYCSWWISYQDAHPEFSEEELCKAVLLKMETQGSMTYYNQLQISENRENMYYYFNYVSYSIMGIIAMGVVTALFFLNKSVVYKRTIASPVSKGQLEMELLLYNVVFAFIVWALHILVGMLMFKESIFTGTGLFMCMNTFALAMSSVGMSYLLLCFTNSQNVIGIFANLIIFGMCFISGTFIPQYLLDKFMRSAAAFTPVSWYIQSNDMINETGALTLSTVSQLLRSIGMQYVFAVMFYCVALFVTKQREEALRGG